MWTMGDDFNYQYAESWFRNMDKLIQHVNKVLQNFNLHKSSRFQDVHCGGFTSPDCHAGLTRLNPIQQDNNAYIF